MKSSANVKRNRRLSRLRKLEREREQVISRGEQELTKEKYPYFASIQGLGRLLNSGLNKTLLDHAWDAAWDTASHSYKFVVPKPLDYIILKLQVGDDDKHNTTDAVRGEEASHGSPQGQDS